MIKRTLAARIKSKIGRGKAIIIVGPRQVGKTTLIKKQAKGEQLDAYEFKWKSKKQVKLPKAFTKKYKATEQVISRKNFRDFVITNNE